MNLSSGSRGTRTHKRYQTPAVFKTVSSSSRMTSVIQAAGVGIEPTASWFRARRHYQQQLPRNKVRKLKHSVRESHPICELQRLAPRLRAGESVLRESNPPRQVGSLEPLPLGQEHMLLRAEGEGVEPVKALSRSTAFEAAAVAIRLDLPQSSNNAELRRQESNLRQSD